MISYLAVKKILFILLVLSAFIPSALFAQGEEFYIVTDGPVAVGGGMFRHYIHSADGRIAIRYKFKGVVENSIWIEKLTSSGPDAALEKELIKIPLGTSYGSNQARFDIGTRAVRLKLNKYGRVSIKELK